MQVRFWGTRGSIPTPGPGTNHFGGNTSCAALTTAGGHLLIFDLGTGARVLGVDMLANAPRPLRGSIMISHTHWDHIQGFPFFVPLFIPGSEFAVHAPDGGNGSLEQTLSGQMEFTYFPVALGQLPAAISYFDLTEGRYEIGGTRVRTQYLHHPASTLGYRVEDDGAAVVYLTDHQPFSDMLWRTGAEPGRIESILHEGDRRHAQFMAGADLVIHDSQYTPEEYAAKRNWGHSSYTYVVELAVAAGVKRLALTHHDPSHDDAFLKGIEQEAQALARSLGSDLEVCCAYEGLEITVGSGNYVERGEGGQVPVAATAGTWRVLVADDDPDVRALARRALMRENHTVFEASNGVEALDFVSQHRPDLVVLDLLMPPPGGLEVLASLRAKTEFRGMPIIVLTSMDDASSTQAAFDLGATDYLTKPFTLPQLAARVRACLARVPGG